MDVELDTNECFARHDDVFKDILMFNADVY